MRLGLVATVRSGDELRAVRSAAAAAEAHGLSAVLIDAPAGLESVAAAFAATATAAIRLAVRLHLDAEHPVTLAEEIAVLDNLDNGRTVVVADPGSLDDIDAAEAVDILERAWSHRPLRRRGRRWTVPAGIAGHQAPPAVIVTPPPAQVEIPVWLWRPVNGLDRPVLATAPSGCDAAARTQPGRARLADDLEADRAVVAAWASAGATHLFVETGDLTTLAGRLAPEVAMVGFPTVITAAPPPARWPAGS